MAIAPPALNLQPFGLLSFLGIKNGGEYPQQLISTLQPTLDLWEHYVAANREEYTLACANQTGAIGSATNIQITTISPTPPGEIILVAGQLLVPQTELWYVISCSVAWTMPAEAAAYIDADWIFGRVRFPLGLSGWTTGIAGNTRGGRRSIDRPVWLTPGTALTPQNLGSNSTAATFVSAHLSVARLRI